MNFTPADLMSYDRRAEESERRARQLEASVSDAQRQADQARLRQQESQQLTDDLKR